MFKKKQNDSVGVAEKSFTVKEITAIIIASREAGVDEISTNTLHIKFQPKAAITPAKTISIDPRSPFADVDDTLKPLQDYQDILTDPSAFEKSALGE